MQREREELIDQTLAQFPQTKLALGKAALADWLHLPSAWPPLRAD